MEDPLTVDPLFQGLTASLSLPADIQRRSNTSRSGWHPVSPISETSEIAFSSYSGASSSSSDTHASSPPSSPPTFLTPIILPPGTNKASTSFSHRSSPSLDGMHKRSAPPPLRIHTSPSYTRKSLTLQLSATSSPVTRHTTSHSLTPAGSGLIWIGLYFVFNMGLTLYNKTVLVHFPFPYTLTALHTFCGTVGCLWLRRIGYYTPARLTRKQDLTLALFSILYTLNIAVSNLSLQLVTVPFHQVVRASAPFFTIVVAFSLRGGKGKGLLGVGKRKLVSLIPVIMGVGFATYGDYSFTAWGLVLTLLGTLLAALKTVLTSILQSSPAHTKQHLASTPLPMTTTQSSFPLTPKPHVAGLPSIGAGFPRSPSSGKGTGGFLSPLPESEKVQEKDREQRTRKASVSVSISLSSPIASLEEPGTTGSWWRKTLESQKEKLAFMSKRFDLDFGLGSRGGDTGTSTGVAVKDQSIKLHPLDLLMRMSPLACIQCLIYAFISGEFTRLQAHQDPRWGMTGEGFGVFGMMGMSGKGMMVLGLNGVIAFLLNVVSLTANQKNGPLTMTVAANVKQVLTILLAVSVFDLTIAPTNILGIALTLTGGAWYGALELKSKKERMAG